MCPLCIANIAVLATTSSRGVVAIALKTFRSRRRPNEKGQENENNTAGIKSTSGVSEGVGGCAPAASREGEGVDPRPRRACRRASADAVDGCREGVHVRRPQREGEPVRPVRRPPAVDRLPCLLRAGRGRLARTCMRRLLHGGRPGCSPRSSERPRYYTRVLLFRAAEGYRAPKDTNGLAVHSLVHDHGRLRQGLRRGLV